MKRLVAGLLLTVITFPPVPHAVYAATMNTEKLANSEELSYWELHKTLTDFFKARGIDMPLEAVKRDGPNSLDTLVDCKLEIFRQGVAAIDARHAEPKASTKLRAEVLEHDMYRLLAVWADREGNLAVPVDNAHLRELSAAPLFKELRQMEQRVREETK